MIAKKSDAERLAMAEAFDIVIAWLQHKGTAANVSELASMCEFVVFVQARNPDAPQPAERNFCGRCGKRLGDVDSIHTCTPPAAVQPAEPLTDEQIHELAQSVALLDGGCNVHEFTRLVEAAHNIKPKEE